MLRSTEREILEKKHCHGRIYSQRGPVQKKCGGRFTYFFLEKNWRSRIGLWRRDEGLGLELITSRAHRCYHVDHCLQGICTIMQLANRH